MRPLKPAPPFEYDGTLAGQEARPGAARTLRDDFQGLAEPTGTDKTACISEATQVAGKIAGKYSATNHVSHIEANRVSTV